MDSDRLHEKYVRLQAGLGSMGRVLVAFSGGVDSALLLWAARQALPGGVLAVTFAAPYSPEAEIAEARALARAMGVPHRLAAVSIPDVLRDNPPERCYLCKGMLFGELMRLAGTEGIAYVLDGSNLDDLKDHRPGRKAAKELGVKSPLLDAGLTKEDIRALSREEGLSTWDKPSGACLLTRLPHGSPVTEAELGRIDAGEAFLRELGFLAVRLRSHGDVARIEVPAQSIAAITGEGIRDEIHARLVALGYRHVSLDLAGYRMGSLNAAPAPAKGGSHARS